MIVFYPVGMVEKGVIDSLRLAHVVPITPPLLRAERLPNSALWEVLQGDIHDRHEFGPKIVPGSGTDIP